MKKILSILGAIDAHLSEIAGCLVYLCHAAEIDRQNEDMKREPSTFSRIKILEPGETASLPSEKTYAATCACSYLEAEYERSFSISPDGETVSITRLT